MDTARTRAHNKLEAANGGAPAPDREQISEPAVQAAAEILFRDYESQYSADHMTWREFADLAREVLKAAAPHMQDTERLEAAEQVCLMFGWTGTRTSDAREKAMFQLWRRWLVLSGVSAEWTDHPELNDDRIAELAAEYDGPKTWIPRKDQDRG